MVRRRVKRTIGLLSATAYVLALVFSNLLHVHVHALGETEPAHTCDVAADHDSIHHGHAHHEHARNGHAHHGLNEPCDAELAGGRHEHHGAPESDDDCNICRFLGLPILLVRPFEIAQVSQQVTRLPALRAPAMQPVTLVVTQARAPPCATQFI